MYILLAIFVNDRIKINDTHTHTMLSCLEGAYCGISEKVPTVNVIIARGLLWVSAQELPYLPDPFCIRFLLFAHGRKSSCLRSSCSSFSLLVFLVFLLAVLFPSARLVHCPEMFPCQSPSVKGGIVQAVRAMHECPASWKGCPKGGGWFTLR